MQSAFNSNLFIYKNCYYLFYTSIIFILLGIRIFFTNLPKSLGFLIIILGSISILRIISSLDQYYSNILRLFDIFIIMIFIFRHRSLFRYHSLMYLVIMIYCLLMYQIDLYYDGDTKCAWHVLFRLVCISDIIYQIYING